jgi:hypothetical protein
LPQGPKTSRGFGGIPAENSSAGAICLAEARAGPHRVITRSARKFAADRAEFGRFSACAHTGYLCRPPGTCPRKSAAMGLFAEAGRTPYAHRRFFRIILLAAGPKAAVKIPLGVVAYWSITRPNRDLTEFSSSTFVLLRGGPILRRNLGRAGSFRGHPPHHLHLQLGRFCRANHGGHPGQSVAAPLLAHRAARANPRHGIQKILGKSCLTPASTSASLRNRPPYGGVGG